MKKVTQSFIDAAANVFILEAKVKTIKPIVEAYKERILKEMNADIAPEWVERGEENRKILDPKQAYLLSDQDAKVYFDRLQIENKRAGFNVPDECCPLLCAESELSKAQKKMINAAENFTGFNTDSVGLWYDFPNRYNKAVNLLKGLATSATKDKIIQG